MKMLITAKLSLRGGAYDDVAIYLTLHSCGEMDCHATLRFARNDDGFAIVANGRGTV